MAPKRFNLGLQVPPEEPQQNDVMNRSMNPTDNGGVNIFTRSLNTAYEFTEEGMTRSSTPSSGGQSFKVSEKDLNIVKTLGRGASSVVHKAFYAEKNKFVAIKKISVFEKEKRSQLMNDVKALCDAPPNLPGLVQFLGAYHVPESGQISIVLEYMDGGSLGDVLQKVKKIPENILSKITEKVLHGLTHLHRKSHMVHRDIKPANILVNLDGEPKITDFGISAFIDNTLAVCHTFLGTVTYMSPERINSAPYSYPADIWSLGLALYESAMGHYPYDANVGPLQLMIQVVEEPSPIPPPGQFSDEFRDFVAKCLMKDPAQRPTAEALLQHPYITKWRNVDVDVKSFMQCVFDPQDRLDEIAVRFATNYYAITSAGAARLQELLPLYTQQSIMAHEGETVRGQTAILAKLQGVGQMNSTFGRVVYEVDHIDAQALGTDGSAIVSVMGRMVVAGMSHLGEGASHFCEMFTLAPSQPYYIANQVFRLLK
mmetsp:Transcript_39505/g.100942  ORF Transcript_39505/g.100942 Transcript_39505/m.100942 type:complete len:484 (-) Transcript_39505:27-1478(-)